MNGPGGARPVRLGAVRDALWDALADGDEQRARAGVLAALDDGLPAEDALLDVVAAVQRQVGAEWAANRLTVAEEHAATAINDRVVSAIAAHRAAAPDQKAARGRITVACVDGEWHALPARLLAEVLRLRGWRADFLGAQLPVPDLVTHVHRTGPDAIALSSSLAVRLPTAHATITACQAAGVPVLAGGGAFGADGHLARLLGADAWAPDARAAADRLAAGLPRPHPADEHRPIDDLPDAAHQEYTRVTRDAVALVRETMAGLTERVPGVREYSDTQRQHTAQDIGHLADFLATALYCDDDDLFIRFTAWTADILAARGVPARSLTSALDLLAAELADLPRATRLLDAARRALAARTAGA